MTTKIPALVDAWGNLVGLRPLPGQRHNIGGVEPLLGCRELGGALSADKAFDADWLVEDLAGRGSKVVISPRSNRKAPRENDKEMYEWWWHLVENFFCKLKALKKVAMRAEKTDSSFSANIYLAATHRLTIMSTVPILILDLLRNWCSEPETIVNSSRNN